MSDKKGSNNTPAGNADNSNQSSSKSTDKLTNKTGVDANVSPNISFSTSTSSAATPKPTTSTVSSSDTKATTDNVDKKPTTKDDAKKSQAKIPASKSAATTSSAKTKSSASKKTAENHQNRTGKVTAIIALAIAIISILASVGHYFWQQQQTNAQLLALSQENQRAIQQSQAKLEQALSATFNQQLEKHYQVTNQSQQSAQQAHSETDQKLQLLTAQVSQLDSQVSQRDPSDWLVHEAEYLVRIAARTMWLERDTSAAINLLRDADSRLKELNRSKFLPVRALINEDIEDLALMPPLTNEEAVLTLMALNKLIPSLSISGVNLAEELHDIEEDFELSDDLNDWQDNLARTWKKFIKDFISVRRRTGMVEPLMSPNQQQNLKQNLSLKIQLAQWAASEQKNEVYQQTLLDIQQWLNEYFDMELQQNKSFYNSVESLKSQTIYYDYPSDLRSLTLIKRLLKETKEGKKTNSANTTKNKIQPETIDTVAPSSSNEQKKVKSSAVETTQAQSGGSL